MRTFLKTVGILLIIGIIAKTVSGQEANPAAGGEARGAGGQASITVGQAIYTTYSVQSGSTSQGVQQAYFISVVTSAGTLLAGRLDCRVYPNPVQEKLALELKGDVEEGLYYKLYDMNGKLLDTKNMDENLTLIPMGHLPTSAYLLRVEASGMKEIKTFKIIKQ